MADQSEDEFDKAFAEAVAEVDGANTPPLETPPVPPVGDPPADPPAPVETPAPPVEPPTEPPAPVEPPAPAPVPAPAAAPTPASAPPAASPPPSPAPEPPKETPEQKAQREAFEASLKPYEPSDEEKAALAQFKKDFPNEAIAVEARLKSVDRDINARVYDAVQRVYKQVESRIAPVEKRVVDTSVEAHFSAIRSAHQDFDAVAPKLADWIATLSPFDQPGRMAVYQGGDAQSVIALVAEYKKATGAPPPPPPPAAPPAPRAKPSGADDLAPVDTKRVAVLPKGTPDPHDFKSAWDEAVNALGG